MDIWVVKEGEHMPQITGKGRTLRAGMLADYFSVPEDNDVTWWLSTFLHYEKKFYANKSVDIDLKENLHLKMLHVNKAYRKNISLDRIIYCKLLAKKFRDEIKSVEKPDIIYCSWPLIELSYECVRYGKANNIPVIIDIRDLWPDIFIQPFKGIIQKAAKIAINFLYGKKTKYVMQNADKIIGVVTKCLEFASGYGRKIKKTDEVVYLSYKKSKFYIDKSFIDSLGIKESDFVVVYYGSIDNRKDNMDIIIEAAQNMKNRNVKFVICGSGSAVEDCRKRTADLNNIVFTGLMNSNQISSISEYSKLGLLPYRNTEDFVDALPNKFAEYLSFGMPVLTTLKGLSKNKIEEKNCGSYFDTAQQLNELIYSYSNDESFYNVQRQNALKLYEDEFNADKVYPRLLNEMKLLIKK